MSIEKIYPEDLETFSLDLHPKFVYESSSSGITGSAYVYAFRSNRLKDPYKDTAYSGSVFDEGDLRTFLDRAKRASYINSNNNSQISEYIGIVDNKPASRRQSQKVEMLRLTPTYDLNETFNKKTNILKNIYGYSRYSNTHFAFTNYNSLNFFTSSEVPNDSVLIYANSCSMGTGGIISGAYIPNDGFAFDFWINPRYSTDTPVSTFKAGTILHLSGVYALSLISGSGKDPDNLPKDFRIVLQVSGGVSTAPSLINTSSLPNLCFISSDGSLKRNTWHHITVRWGTNVIANGSGSIVIDNTVDSYFNIPSSSIVPLSSSTFQSPTALMVGNFYEGTNSGVNNLKRFFSTDVGSYEGLDILDSGATGYTEPTAYTLTHPLNAEISDLKIYNRYITNSEILDLSSSSPTNRTDLLFYLPVFFTPYAPTRTYNSTTGKGGILQTPFYAKTGTPAQPVSSDLSFEIGAHYVNLQNFTQEFIAQKFPRLLNLTASRMTAPSPMPSTANEILYATSSVRKSSLTILPCDNGSFVPNFKTWLSQSYISSASFKNDLGITDYSFVTNRNVWSGSYWPGIYTDTLISGITGPYPEDSTTFTKAPSYVATLYQRTRNTDSNQFMFFDISNLFYGKRINPGSIEIVDINISGSGNKVSIKLKDDGFGNIYRADSAANHATWNSVGNVFYDEGLIVIKHPSLYFYGKNQYKITLKGEQSIHTSKINCYMRPLMETSSSNPSYQKIDINTNANDPNKNFVYVTEVLIHDNNLNVIGRAKLAQPYMKKIGDKTMIKFSMDY